MALEVQLLENLGWILVSSAVFVTLLSRLGVPTIVTYLLVGLVLGPLAGVLVVDESLDLIAEFGIALLLFLVGLELSFEKIRHLGAVAVAAGLGQIVFTALGGTAIALVLGFDPLEAALLATALTFSSTVVVVKLLDQKRELDTLYGRIAVGIFLVQDLVVVVALTVLYGLGTDAAGLSLGPILIALLGMVLLLVLALGASRFLLPRLFAWAATSTATLFVWGLCWCFLLVLLAETMGLSPEIGAFLAGLALAQLPYNDDLRRRVHPLMSFFVAVFFVTLGARMEVGVALAEWPTVVALSLFVVVGKPVFFIAILAFMGYRERTCFLTSVTLAQISEFSFILAATAMAVGLIDARVASVVGAVGLITIAASAFMILFNEGLFTRMQRWRLLAPLRVFRRSARIRDREAEPEKEAPLCDHVIVVGMNPLGRRVVEGLASRGEPVVAVDLDPAKLAGLPAKTVHGDVAYSSALHEAGLDRARLLISLLHIEETNRMLAYRAREIGVPACIHAFDERPEEELRRLGAHILATHEVARQALLAELERREVLPA